MWARKGNGTDEIRGLMTLFLYTAGKNTKKPTLVKKKKNV